MLDTVPAFEYSHKLSGSSVWTPLGSRRALGDIKLPSHSFRTFFPSNLPLHICLIVFDYINVFVAGIAETVPSCRWLHFEARADGLVGC